ncbi:MAG: ferrous iron transport protein B [Deltaproteobacteria bacterium]|nr:ferrous iron transport protein B [Deltaproteobacteria bacterium]
MDKCCEKKSAAPEVIPRVALIGNPNVGKSVIFGWLTGQYVAVSNYPGTAVEVAQGNSKVGGRRRVIVDTPGINNLIPMSEDERVTRDILLDDEDLKVIQVCDAKNLRRGLMITLQLAEMEKPVVLVLNMADEAKERGITIDRHGLAQLLEIPVLSTIATRRKGLDGLGKVLEESCTPQVRPIYSPEIEEGVTAIENLLPEKQKGKRALALMLLAGDESLQDWLHCRLSEQVILKIEEISRRLQSQHQEPLGFFINQKRLNAVDRILEGVFRKEKRSRGMGARALSNLTTHPIGGVPILLAVLYAMYKWVGDFGAGIGVDFLLNVVFGKAINPAVTWVVEYLFPWQFLQEFFVGPYGLVTMGLTYAIAIVLPIVGTFFFAFGLLEDSGYLPRLAVMVNRVFRVMGLSGKAVLPMVLGLGCDTMATLTTRVLETKKERILVTLLLALGVPCSAQIGVMVGMFAGLSMKAIVLWAFVVMGSMIFVGLLASKLIPGEKADFIMEIPPLRIPTLANIFIKTLARLEWFLKEAVPLFLLGTFFLFALDRLGLLKALQNMAAPIVVGFLGLPAKASQALLLGFLRRDYGAAGLFVMAKAGELDSIQIVVSLVTITLFVPCVANFFMIIKERGLGQALAMAGFIFPFALIVGGGLNFLLRFLGVNL